MAELDRRGQTNHARDRIYGGGQPFELTVAPTAEDRRRWLLVNAERVVEAEEGRVNDPPPEK